MFQIGEKRQPFVPIAEKGLSTVAFERDRDHPHEDDEKPRLNASAVRGHNIGTLRILLSRIIAKPAGPILKAGWSFYRHRFSRSDGAAICSAAD